MRLTSIRPHTIDLPLTHPGTKKPLGITLQVVGKDSTAFQSLMQEVAAAREAGNMPDAMTLGRRIITTCVVGVREEDAFEGGFSTEKLDKLLATGEYGWLAEQVNIAINNREAFFAESLNSSVSA